MLRKVALTSEWDLIQLTDEEGPFALLYNVATLETRTIEDQGQLRAALAEIL